LPHESSPAAWSSRAAADLGTTDERRQMATAHLSKNTTPIKGVSEVFLGRFPREFNGTFLAGSSPTLEELHFTLVLDRCVARLEGAEVPAFSGFRIHLARIESILACL
jgi:hypothetical protein